MGKTYFEWEIDDLECQQIDEVRAIRDDIERRVRLLVVESDVPAH